MLVWLCIVAEFKARRLGRDIRLFENFHSFKLFYAALRRLRRRRADYVSVDIVLKLRPLLLLGFVVLLKPFDEVGFQYFIFGVIARKRSQPFIFYFENSSDRSIEKISVVRHYEDCALEGLQIFFQPEKGRYVEVVRGLVQNEKVGRFQKQTRKFKAGFLAARHGVDYAFVHSVEAHTVKHGLDFHVHVEAVARGKKFIQAFYFGGQYVVFALVTGVCKLRRKGRKLFDRAQFFFENFKHFGVNGVTARIPAVLFEVADFEPVLSYNFAEVGFELAEYQLYQRGLTLAVRAD